MTKDQWVSRGLMWAVCWSIAAPVIVAIIGAGFVIGAGWTMPAWLFLSLAVAIVVWVTGCTWYGHKCIEKAYERNDDREPR